MIMACVDISVYFVLGFLSVVTTSRLWLGPYMSSIIDSYYNIKYLIIYNMNTHTLSC